MKRLRSVLAVALLAFLCLGRPITAAELNTGIVVMTATGGTSSITLDVSIADNGAVPGCTYFLILRDGSLIGIFPRQIGAQNTFQVVDANVTEGRTYWYELVASSIPVPSPSPACPEYDFRVAFGSGWGLPFNIPGHVGEGPIPLAHGKLVADQSFWPYAHLEPCTSPYWWYFEYGGLPAGFEQYLGQDVLMYGDYWWSVQFGWISGITSIEPLPCAPVATKNATWGHVKSIYR